MHDLASPGSGGSRHKRRPSLPTQWGRGPREKGSSQWRQWELAGVSPTSVGRTGGVCVCMHVCVCMCGCVCVCVTFMYHLQYIQYRPVAHVHVTLSPWSGTFSHAMHASIGSKTRLFGPGNKARPCGPGNKAIGHVGLGTRL